MNWAEGLFGVGTAIVSFPAGWGCTSRRQPRRWCSRPKNDDVGVNLKWNSEEYQDDHRACRKALEDVSQVLVDDGNDETSEGPNGDRSPSPSTKIH